ncbi:hypothetical protein V6N13_113171 [Hibiscus sabdariffa]|uniref:Uncharacterized protein n=1 Tax=Hibiscus sabdariffa TaxID=183260 RepID=A0ABR2CTV2_9ROSI
MEADEQPISKAEEKKLDGENKGMEVGAKEKRRLGSGSDSNSGSSEDYLSSESEVENLSTRELQLARNRLIWFPINV